MAATAEANNRDLNIFYILHVTGSKGQGVQFMAFLSSHVVLCSTVCIFFYIFFYNKRKNWKSKKWKKSVYEILTVVFTFNWILVAFMAQHYRASLFPCEIPSHPSMHYKIRRYHYKIFLFTYPRSIFSGRRKYYVSLYNINIQYLLYWYQ